MSDDAWKESRRKKHIFKDGIYFASKETKVKKDSVAINWFA